MSLTTFRFHGFICLHNLDIRDVLYRLQTRSHCLSEKDRIKCNLILYKMFVKIQGKSLLSLKFCLLYVKGISSLPFLNAINVLSGREWRTTVFTSTWRRTPFAGQQAPQISRVIMCTVTNSHQIASGQNKGIFCHKLMMLFMPTTDHTFVWCTCHFSSLCNS